MNVLRCGTVMTAAFFMCASGPAAAEPLDVTLGLTVNAMSGQHEVNGGHSDALTLAPLPLAELVVRRQADSIRIEGLPPVTFGYGSTGDGALRTRLSIVNATYRHAFTGGWFVGAGQTVYNQFTTYVPVNGNFYYTRNFTTDAINGSEAQYSRVTGARFEIGRITQSGRNRFEWWAAANPRMRGVQYTRIPTFLSTCSFAAAGTPPVCTPLVDTFSDPENASQVDLSARVAHHIGKNGEVLFGLRYLNYTAHYDNFPGQLADRNVGVAPTLGYRIKL
jgi:hypothetical protein